MNETILYADIGRVLDDRLIFKSRQRAANFFVLIGEIKRRVLIHQADKNFVAKSFVEPVDNFHGVASKIRQYQMADNHSANHLPAFNLRGTDFND